MAEGAYEPHACLIHAVSSIFGDRHSSARLIDEYNPYTDPVRIEKMKDEIYRRKFSDWCKQISEKAKRS
jgi:hypothetical protein